MPGRSAGEWLFRLRGVAPIPLLIVGFVLGDPDVRTLVLGLGIAAAGEAIRMWAVAHIGGRSRTRGDDVGPLVVGGPFARCRNPLYVGNLLIGLGVVVALAVPLLVPAYVALFFVHYGLIVAWEERRLEAVHGDAFRAYRARVPRWFPGRAHVAPEPTLRAPRGPGAVLRSERSTLLTWIVTFAAVVALAWLRGGGLR